jgi:metallo-beta-lactamase family protein
MKITFNGAAQTVTGSKHLITLDSGLKILLDCGLYQGKGSETAILNKKFDFNPAEIDYLILSHAHIDHSGNIPNLVKQGFTGSILCTPATRDLCVIMLEDSAKIQESDAQYINKRRSRMGQKHIEPLYTIEDADNAMNYFITVPYNRKYRINRNISLLFTDAGHILGSAAINLTIKEDEKIISLCYTGDIGRPNDRILRNPEPFPQADYIITESTYGNRLHENPDDTEEDLLRIVAETCVLKKGKLIIPAFSLDRTQEIIYAFNRMKKKGLLPSIKVFVDSPLSTNATEVMRMHPDCFNKEILEFMRKDPDPFGFNGLTYIRNLEESMRLNHLKDPCIIISASGMMEAGRVKHHLKYNISNPDSTILIVGYCSPSSLGGKLMAGERFVQIFGEEYEVKANIEIMNSYSAHGDYKEMIDYLSCQEKNKIKKIFLVHGEPDVQSEYREHLIKAGFRNIEIPKKNEIYETE